MTTALPCAHQHKKLVNALWCGDCGAYNELDGNNWQLPSGRVAKSHPQREALDEEKVRKIIDKIAIVVDGEIKFLPLTTIYEITKEICSLSLPSLSDLLSALPEKIDNITPTLMNANHVCDCYNMAIDACIAALTKRMEELNEKN